MRRHTRPRTRAFSLLLAAVTVGALTGGIASADETPKVAVVITSPDEVGAGTTTGFTVSLTNQADPQQLGSANVTVPAGFVLLSTSDPTGPATAVVNGSTVELRELSLPPNGTVSVTVTAVAPCAAGTYGWTAQVKQANDFSGLPGNDFAIGAGSDLTTDATGTCSVGFGGLSFVAQPTSAEQNTTITTATFDPTGNPVQVALLDADGKVVTESSLQTTVTVAIGTNAGDPDGVLSGDTQEPTGGGIATFGSLKIDEPGLGYTLRSTSATVGIASGTSAGFDIANDGGVCNGGGNSCTNSDSEGSTTAAFSSTSSETGYYQFLAFDVQTTPLDCLGNSYVEVTTEATWETNASTGTAQVTLTVQRSGLPRSRRSLNSFQVCYGSFTSFTPRPGTSLVTLPGPEYVGLLPECSDVSGLAPCVLERFKTSRTFSIRFSTPISGTRGRG